MVPTPCQTLADYRNFIPAPPSVITEESWRVRNQLAQKHYPHIADLLAFTESHLIEILLDVEQDEKPSPDRYVGHPGAPRPLAILPRRSHLEWHLFRGVAPNARRPSIGAGLRASVLRRDGLICQICFEPVEPSDVHLDHIHPFSRGGQTTLKNLRVTHSRCNLSKGARV